MNNNNTSVVQKNVTRKDATFNFIDFLLIVVILLIVAALIYVFLPSSLIKGLFADDTVEIQYTIEIKGIDENFLSNVKENDVVINAVSKSNIGTVTAVDYSTQYTILEYNEASQSGVLSVVPGKYNMVITINASAHYTEGEGYTINGTRIAVGEQISLRFPSFVGKGYCISVPVK